jgi:hypothetical protein
MKMECMFHSTFEKEFFMKNFGKLLGIIALVTIIGLSMMACGGDDDSSSGGGGFNPPSVGKLPDFPSGTTPAESRADAETILAELSNSYVLWYVEDEIWEVVEANVSYDSNSYNIKDKSLPDGSVKVSASGTYNETNTGGFKTLFDNSNALWDLYEEIAALWEDYYDNYGEIQRLQDEIDSLYEVRDTIPFAKGDKTTFFVAEEANGELTKGITEDGVTVAKGSTYKAKFSESENFTVTTGGTYKTFRGNGGYSEKQQIMGAFTVTTSSGSVKIILDLNAEWGATGTNVQFYSYDDYDDVDVGTWKETEKYSGSLKVYGSNNAVLINQAITDWETFAEALNMIGYGDGDDDNSPGYAISAKNVKGNENISSQSSGSLLKKTYANCFYQTVP